MVLALVTLAKMGGMHATISSPPSTNYFSHLLGFFNTSSCPLLAWLGFVIMLAVQAWWIGILLVHNKLPLDVAYCVVFTDQIGSLGFVAINNEDYTWIDTFITSLPAGMYCDVLSGHVSPSGACTGNAYAKLGVCFKM
jgi:hypothetical protein